MYLQIIVTPLINVLIKYSLLLHTLLLSQKKILKIESHIVLLRLYCSCSLRWSQYRLIEILKILDATKIHFTYLSLFIFLNLLSLRYKTIVSGIVVWCRGWSSLGMPASCIIMPDLSTAVLFLFCFLLMHTLRESRWWWLKYLGHWNMGDQSGTQVEFRVPDLTWYSPLQLWVLGEWTNG